MFKEGLVLFDFSDVVEINEGVKVCITGRKEENANSRISVMINL